MLLYSVALGLTTQAAPARISSAPTTMDGSGGTVRYAVSSGASCWNARRVDSGLYSGMPATATGCARLRDVLGLFDY